MFDLICTPLTEPRQIQHTYPLTQDQKSSIARSITSLHSRTFLTPSLFVNVTFHHLKPDNGENAFFLAGEPLSHNAAGPNRILAQVRQSPKRTKADFDGLAEKINQAWDEALQVSANDTSNGVSKADYAAKKLHFVAFSPMITGIENGIAIPDVSIPFRRLVPPLPST
jgi:phenylpyruvate tautomerase PptA (4-oxalocrotonate tautomerase family)